MCSSPGMNVVKQEEGHLIKKKGLFVCISLGYLILFCTHDRNRIVTCVFGL